MGSAAGLAALTGALLSATPAAAQPLNCFEWVRQTAAHIVPQHPRQHLLGAVAHVTRPRPHPRPVHHIVHPARPRPIATHMVRRPIACPTNEVAMASPVPGAAPPQTAQMLLDELAGPPAAEAAAVPVTAVAPESLPEAASGGPALGPEDFGGPGLVGPGIGGGGPGGGGPGGGFPSGGPIISGPGGVVTPVTPGGPGVPGTPDTPVITPLPPEGPGFPGVDTPPGGPLTPPEVIIPVTPVTPGGPGGGGPGGGPGGPGTPGGVPEPAAWFLMLVGFGAVGGALRRHRQGAAERGEFSA